MQWKLFQIISLAAVSKMSTSPVCPHITSCAELGPQRTNTRTQFYVCKFTARNFKIKIKYEYYYNRIPLIFARVWEDINPYPTAFPYGNGMVLHFYQQKESSTTKTVHKVINKGLKTYV